MLRKSSIQAPACLASREIATYALALGLCLLILTFTLRLWQADLRVPLAYSGDSLFTQLWIKGIFENGWYLQNDAVGAPLGSDLRDFPMTDNLHFFILKCLGLGWADTALVFNIYYLLSYPLATLTAFGVLRHLRLGVAPSLVAGLLYTFLPYHFLRGMTGHLFLAAYFLVPLAILMALWLVRTDPGEPPARWSAGKLIVSVLICLLLASTGVYYAFFSCFLLCLAGVLAALERRSVRPLGLALLLTSVIVLGALANLYPILDYRRTHGVNSEAVLRLAIGTEIYGLKITQLLLPPSYHRLHFLAVKKLAYNTEAPLGSGDYWYLGVVGLIGFFCLLLVLLARGVRECTPGILSTLALFNVSSILFATASGFGAVFSFLVLPELRAYERMSIFIAFFALFTVALLLDRLSARFGAGRGGRCLSFALAGLVLSLGIWDQTSRQLVPAYDVLKAQYGSDDAFVRAIEATAPSGAMIFQLPFVPFPENPPVQRMTDYDHLRGYLHSRSLRWSYGCVKGTKGNSWQKQLANQPTQALVRLLAEAGFHGVYLDRFGFADGGAAIESDLKRLTCTKPLVSRDKRLVFFKLPDP